MSSWPPELHGSAPLVVNRCTGTRLYPGCGALFGADSLRKKFCPECRKLDRASSFVFFERRRPVLLDEEEE